MTALDLELHVIKEVARGGMGTVELAFRSDGGFRRMYAVKRLKEGKRDDPDALRRLKDEARLTGELRHPNAVSVLDVGQDDRGPYLVMDFVFGFSLRELSSRLRAKDQRFPLQLALRVGTSVGHALWAAHSMEDEEGNPVGLIHRDVTPGNVLVGFDGVVRLVDFGLAKATADGASANLLHGTSGYLAPEQLRFEGVDVRTDLFAFGVVLHELITGERLYGDTDVRTAARRTLLDPVPDLRDFDAETPDEIADLVKSLLAKDPGDRPASSATVTRDLELALRRRVHAEGPIDLLGFLETNFADTIATRRQELFSLWRAFDRKRPNVTVTISLQHAKDETTARLRHDQPTARSNTWVGAVAVAFLVLLVGSVVWVTRPAPRPSAKTLSLPEPAEIPAEPVVEPATEMATPMTRRRRPPRMRARPRPAKQPEKTGRQLWNWE
ncbi:MAG: serine/threonine-protein kinase [Myxococcota bacterium]